ncbi:MAG: PH domain-containing protein [Phycisphaeraceae bacterium]
MKRLLTTSLPTHETADPGPAFSPRAMTPQMTPHEGDAPRAHAEPGSGPEGAAEIDNQVSSLLPNELIQPNEIIILLLKPSLWFVLLPSLSFLIGLVVLAVVAITLRNAGHLTYLTRQDIVLCVIGLAGIRLFWQFLEWLSRIYVLTDQRIIRIKGVLRVQVFETPLKKVQHTETVFTVKERIVGVGTILFATAGTASYEAAWLMVAQPLEVHRIVVQSLSRYGR